MAILNPGKYGDGFHSVQEGYVHVDGWRRLAAPHRTIGLRIQHVLYGKYRVYLIVCSRKAIKNNASTFFNKGQHNNESLCTHGLHRISFNFN
jgi:hypothetical protein